MIAGSGGAGAEVTGNRSGCLPMMALNAFQPQISSLHVGGVAAMPPTPDGAKKLVVDHDRKAARDGENYPAGIAAPRSTD